MNRFNRLMILFVSVLSIFSTPLFALDILVVDQHGKPVKDAYVAVPQGKIETPDKTLAVMDQIDVSFVPHVLAVDQGQAVVLPNSDNIRHHVYSFSEPKKFEIKLYQGVPKQPIYFEQPGLVALGCNIHDSMLGYIYVSPWPEYGVTNAEGKISVSEMPSELALWHPLQIETPGLIRMKLDAANHTEPVKVSLALKKEEKRKHFKSYRRSYDD